MIADIKGKKVTVVGLAKSGMAAALLLKEKGAEVSGTDCASSVEILQNSEVLKSRGIEAQTGGHTKEFINRRDFIVQSPGVPAASMPLLWAKEANLPVISEIELGFWFCRAPIIAVTGTNGKSTVTTLIGELLRGAGRDVFICGNIGTPLCEEISSANDASVVVLEVSSFQLQGIKYFRPKVSVLLNVTQNHLDRHTSFDDYSNAKKRIFSNQKGGDSAVLFYDDPVVRAAAGDIRADVLYFSLRENVHGAYRSGGMLFLMGKPIMRAGDIKIPGEHNVSNALAAMAAVSKFGVNEKAIAATLSRFGGLEHRFEFVRCLNGVRYINDSKATSVDATRQALLSLQKNVILIAGGRDKKSDFGAIKDAVAEKAKAVILVGESKGKIRDGIADKVPIEFAGSLEDAVKRAREIAVDGDTVLLSPMCASFDMFRDFEERGRIFKESVLGL